MSILDLPTEIIAKIGDTMHHYRWKGEPDSHTMWHGRHEYKHVLRFSMSATTIKNALQSETDKRYTTALEKWGNKDDRAFASTLPPKDNYRHLLPSRNCLVQYTHSIRGNRWAIIYRKHAAKCKSRGGDNDTEYYLGHSIPHQIVKQYGIFTRPRLEELPETAAILVLRLHRLSQNDVNKRTWILHGLVNGMKQNGDTYLVLPHDYNFTDQQKKWIHALFGRYFTTTIGELKEALAKDEATEGVKAEEEYNSAPCS